MRRLLIFFSFLCVFGVLPLQAVLPVSDVSADQEVFLADVWRDMTAMVSDLRNWSQNSWRVGADMAVESVFFPQDPDIDGLDRSAMIRTTLQYDDALSLGVSANQSFSRRVWIRLGSEWQPAGSHGLSLKVFSRLDQHSNATPVGVSAIAQVADIQIECAYNKGVAPEDRNAVHVSMGMVL